MHQVLQRRWGVDRLYRRRHRILLGPASELDRLLVSSETNVGETYFALLEIDYSTSAKDVITASVYDELAQRISEETYTALTSTTTSGASASLTADWGFRPIIDEMRYGTTIGDVASGVHLCQLGQ